MAFRIEAAIIALVAQTLLAAPVEHRHLHHGGAADLAVTDEGISFTEKGKHAAHSRTWKYDQIQQLELTSSTLRVLTYEDQSLQLGRDREYVFDQLPKDFAPTVYAKWKDKLDQRFIAALADPEVKTLAEFPAKLTGLTKGTEGTLRFAEDRIVFQSPKPGASRTWRLTDIDNIATAGPFDFTVTTFEHQGTWNTATREFHFQLQTPMEEARFNDLWRRLHR
ncbi:MAG TPA: hypothetical protein VGL72_33665 [Bryobacteraceae bacterium]